MLSLGAMRLWSFGRGSLHGDSSPKLHICKEKYEEKPSAFVIVVWMCNPSLMMWSGRLGNNDIGLN